MAVNENCATDKTIFNGLDKAENGASVFYLPVYIYFPVPWATYRPEIWAAYEAKDRDSLKVEYEKVMYDYMDDWLTNGNNSETAAPPGASTRAAWKRAWVLTLA